LLLIGIGTDTKKLGDFSQYNKIYEATIDLSQQSDTRDSDYRQHHIHYAHDEHSITLNDQIIPAPSEQTIIKLCQSLIPCYDLPLPAFSAKKVKGKKLYDLARKGIDLQRVQTMNIHRIDLIEYKFPLIRLRCDV
jgi:tRNA pseudouridine55 synthase